MPLSRSQLKIVHNISQTKIASHVTKRSIGSILLSQNWITESDILKAWSIQRHEKAPIGEILTGLGIITIDQLYWALGEQFQLELIDLSEHPPITRWTDYTDPQTALKKGYLTWHVTEQSHIFAITDPTMMEEIRSKYHYVQSKIDFVLVKPEAVQKFVALDQSKTLQHRAVNSCPPDLSCQTLAQSGKLKTCAGLIVISVIALAVISPVTILHFLLGVILTALIMLFCFRLTCLIAAFNPKPTPKTVSEISKNFRRPKVSILVPLFKESQILERLFERLQALAYPTELLEICFIYEEKDYETKAVLDVLKLPDHMKTIEVPASNLQTKPRAMNYALDYCSGDIIGIYDAEDAPETQQIEHIIQKFALADDNVACVQCILDFYNPKTNWISRCFTIEYAILFRIIIPALDRLNLPIPLGGTSVFFRRDILEELGRWDAYNVTEDADLGYRLHRMGYRCEWLRSTTYEEANYRIIPWIKQRSRWLKGLFLTALVHFRSPKDLQSKIGVISTFSMACMTIVPWVLCPLAPIIMPIWILSLNVDLPIYSALPAGFTTVLIATFVATEILSFYLGFKATDTSQHKHLRPWILTTIFYWPITCFASYKALYEIFTCPAYWDKSEHGVNDQSFAREIKYLTGKSYTR